MSIIELVFTGITAVAALISAIASIIAARKIISFTSTKKTTNSKHNFLNSTSIKNGGENTGTIIGLNSGNIYDKKE